MLTSTLFEITLLVLRSKKITFAIIAGLQLSIYQKFNNKYPPCSEKTLCQNDFFSFRSNHFYQMGITWDGQGKYFFFWKFSKKRKLKPSCEVVFGGIFSIPSKYLVWFFLFVFFFPSYLSSIEILLLSHKRTTPCLLSFTKR